MKFSLLIASLLTVASGHATQFEDVQDLNQTSFGFSVSKTQKDLACSKGEETLLLNISRNDQNTHFKLQSKKTGLVEKYLSMNIDEAGGEVLTSAFEYIDQNKDQKADQLDQHLTTQGKDFLLNKKHRLSSDCRMAGSELKKSKKEDGIFTMASGKSVQAQRTIKEFSGDVMCAGRILGSGSMNVIEIESKDCYSTKLIIGMTFKVDGKTIESFRSEVLDRQIESSKKLLSRN
jgi:hypothetical protein